MIQGNDALTQKILVNAHELQPNDVPGRHLVPTTNFGMLPQLASESAVEVEVSHRC